MWPLIGWDWHVTEVHELFPEFANAVEIRPVTVWCANICPGTFCLLQRAYDKPTSSPVQNDQWPPSHSYTNKSITKHLLANMFLEKLLFMHLIDDYALQGQHMKNDYFLSCWKWHNTNRRISFIAMTSIWKQRSRVLSGLCVGHLGLSSKSLYFRYYAISLLRFYLYMYCYNISLSSK